MKIKIRGTNLYWFFEFCNLFITKGIDFFSAFFFLALIALDMMKVKGFEEKKREEY